MTVDDAIFNWLQIRHVARQKPEDPAAAETYQFFTTILEEDHKLRDIRVEVEDSMHTVYFMQGDSERKKTFPNEFVYQLLHDLEEGPYACD